jgi:hypothetical protein
MKNNKWGQQLIFFAKFFCKIFPKAMEPMEAKKSGGKLEEDYMASNYTNPNKLLFEFPHPNLLPLEKGLSVNLLGLVLPARNGK